MQKSQDFRTRSVNMTFGVRAASLIIRNDEILLIKGTDNLYYTFGGAIQVGESSDVGAVREVKEELGIDVQINQLAFIVENQFIQEGITFHNVEFHYIVSPLEEPPLVMVENGKQYTCEWVCIKDLPSLDVRPKFLKEMLPTYDGTLQHVRTN